MALIAEIKKADGTEVVKIDVPVKEFKTGSRGFYANSKLELDGKRYQVQIQIVEIGSKGAGGK